MNWESSQIHWNVEANIKEGCFKNLNHLIKKMQDHVRKNEPDTLGYSFYFNANKDKLFIYECYKDNAAALKHMEGFNQFAKDFFDAVDIEKINMFGKVNDEIQSIFDNLSTTYWRKSV
jgi:quinol monooxygenase YgiN